MTPGRSFTAKLEQIAALVAEMPDGASATIEWADAPPDLVLAIAQQEHAVLRTVDGSDEAEWLCDGVVVRVRRQAPPTIRRPVLRIVK